jgi:phage-related protein|tara:strand:- start:425 stop:766 length:342 start_codon:yes stop_codon:yes gene_type:complete
MATFPSLDPDFGAAKRAQPRVRVSQFGSGYSQRTVFGINQDPKVWTLTWENRSETDSNTIEDFLEARAGQEAFDWSPPDDSSTYKWICREWDKQLPYPNLFTITATFEQVFEA